MTVSTRTRGQKLTFVMTAADSSTNCGYTADELLTPHTNQKVISRCESGFRITADCLWQGESARIAVQPQETHATFYFIETYGTFAPCCLRIGTRCHSKSSIRTDCSDLRAADRCHSTFRTRLHFRTTNVFNNRSSRLATPHRPNVPGGEVAGWMDLLSIDFDSKLRRHEALVSFEKWGCRDFCDCEWSL